MPYGSVSCRRSSRIVPEDHWNPTTSREPGPTQNNTRISIGDVGFLRSGRFHLLFSAGSPLGERQPGVDVPTTFEQLDVGTPISGEPRPPGCLHTSTIQQVGAGPVDAGFTPLYVPPLGSPSTILTDELPRSMNHGINFVFDLAGPCGAALVTKYPTYRKDSPLNLAFETYLMHHYKSWVDFARFKQYGNDIRPVLVDGFDMTSDFAMVAYSNKDTPGSNAGNVSMFPSDPGSFPGEWHTRFLPHMNHGPQQRSPPPHEPTMYFSQVGGIGRPADEYNQCVFLRYYTMCTKKWWELFSQGMPMRAGAGPRDLDPGDNGGDALPGLTVRSDAESNDR